MNQNKDTWVSIDNLGGRPYKKTYDFESDFINNIHKKFSECKTGRMNNPVCIDIGIDGWLQRADALKLYEMAYFCEGDILELGTNRGLSAYIMAWGLSASMNNNRKLYTVEINNEFYIEAVRNLQNAIGASLINQINGDANVFMDELINDKKKFGFIFIDHNHDYNHTKEAILKLDRLLQIGGFVLFHDYADPMNITNPGVKVYQAVQDYLMTNENFDFWGCFGCTALFRKIK